MVTLDQYNALPDAQREILKQLWMGEVDGKGNTLNDLYNRLYYPNVEVVQALDALLDAGHVSERDGQYIVSDAFRPLFTQFRREADVFVRDELNKLRNKLLGGSDE